MLFGIVLILLVLAVAFFHYTQGLFSAAISGRSSLIHVRTDRGENVAEHRRVWDAVRARV